MYSIYQENKAWFNGRIYKRPSKEIDMAMESWPKICELLNKTMQQSLIFQTVLIN